MRETRGKKEMQNIFECGHQKVLKSLMQFTNKSFELKTIKAKALSKSAVLSELEDVHSHEDLILFKTEIIGDIYGKSYWLIDDAARQFITDADNGKKIDRDFSFEMLREVDNIISATLISQLSEDFSLKIYGDVPELILPKLKPLREIVESDFQKTNHSLYLYLVEFKILERPDATCTFIWCVEEKKFLQA